jgi:hypothetical protein
MALGKRDPLAPGVYWIDLFPSGPSGDGERTFDTWAANNGPGVTVLRKERGAEANVRIFAVFQVTGAPPALPFPRKLVGSPTIQKLASAPGGVTEADRSIQSDDTVRKPEPAGLFDSLANMDPRAVLVLLAVVILLTQKKR